jgi:FixJ family two-component response regulator
VGGANVKEQTIEKPLVVVVDDDESIREALPDLLGELGFEVRAFASGEAFLGSTSVSEAKCLLLDIAMPGMTGPDVQRELKKRGSNVPIIFITALREESIRKRVIEQGAVDVVLKPFNETALREGLMKAIGGG